jgi:hypothetical protein
LVERFDKPHQVATGIINKLLSVQSLTQETLIGLKKFLVLFSDNVEMIESLNIPNL